MPKTNSVAYRNQHDKRLRWRWAGKCWNCGAKKRDHHAALCDTCGIKNRLRVRKVSGFKGRNYSARFVYREEFVKPRRT